MTGVQTCALPIYEVLGQFRQFLREQNIPVEQSDFQANREYIQQEIKRELVLSVFGSDEAYKLGAAADPLIQKAVELLPRAASLLENARQVIAQRPNP